MSRSGLSEDVENDWEFIKWRGQVASAIRGKRGQAFIRELIEALDAMPEKELIIQRLVAPPEDRMIDGMRVDGDLIAENAVCALGSVGVRRRVELETLDPYDHAKLAAVFDIAVPLVCEIEWLNDQAGDWRESGHARWRRMREWAVSHLCSEKAP